ncbi:arginine biosynthesis bifunctional protein ArgJ beta chain [Leucogyrophana mollusca]|uniref:Arginine biosynthesis bifunctional protein ArgJ beta chain n=1 Tax=Leucogyrophana mollusca TaxID=85980 RepID=A0ACB8BTT6_9AGAM|nr:arginine biosynthesis bifunctional protein ArgJ beta chain [Leucogyrophana mollusca]
MWQPRNPAIIWKRLSSSSTITLKPAPPKAHLHQPIPDSAFPHHFSLTGLHAGVKKPKPTAPAPPDLALILSTSPRPTTAAACFTRNAFQAAPVLVSQAVLGAGAGRARAVVVNSGCANAVTGKRGMEDAWAMVRATDELLGELGVSSPSPTPSETLVMSTGVIGQPLPITRILAGIRAARTSLGTDFPAWERAARAFMTTDTFPKLRARTFEVGGRTYRMAGMDKGAGMIHPNMGPPAAAPQLHATLLGCILTDAAVSPRSLQSALTYAVARSFNSISVDGDMSTNDTIIVLANGAAAGGDPAATPATTGATATTATTTTETHEIDEVRDPAAYTAFRDALTSFAAELAQLVVRDGEGATKFVTVSVESAPTYEDAHRVASTISTSALVKTALYGEDANWGRILSATGSVPLSTPLDPTRVSVSFLPADGTPALPVLVRGEPVSVGDGAVKDEFEARAKEILSQEDFEVRVELGMGKEGARYWTCDFSYEYVRINGDYRS